MKEYMRPIIYEWDGESMVPVNQYFAGLADRQFTIGERYLLEVHYERSVSSHNHQFAWLHDAWQNLPENICNLYPTPEHLRKRALIDCGYYDETAIDCGCAEAAERVAAHLRSKDDFAMVIVHDHFVIERTAKSQSRRAMGRKAFEESKHAILEHIAELIGVEPTILHREAGQAA